MTAVIFNDDRNILVLRMMTAILSRFTRDDRNTIFDWR
jgi:hypothetical protein